LEQSASSDEQLDKATGQQRGMPMTYMELPDSFEHVIPHQSWMDFSCPRQYCYT
jgi:hypothetical protein